MSETLLTLEDAAARLPLPPSGNRVRTVRRLIREKRVPFKKIGRGVFLTQSQFDLLFERLTCSPYDNAAPTGTSVASSKGRARKESQSLSSARDALQNAKLARMRTS